MIEPVCTSFYKKIQEGKLILQLPFFFIYIGYSLYVILHCSYYFLRP